MLARLLATDGARRRPGVRGLLAPFGVVCVFAVACAAPAPADDSPYEAEGFHVVREDAAGVAFEVDVSPAIFSVVGQPDEHIVEMGIPNFQLGGESGAPGLPVRVVWIGIPDGARVAVDGAGLDPVEYGTVRLAPRLAATS